MTIYLTAGIIVSAGPDQSVCVLSDHANLQGTIQNGSPSGTWTATGSGTFQPSADVLNAQYFFSAADVANGSVVLTFTATNTGTCPSGSDQMTLTFGSTSYAFAGADQNLCANSPIAQLAGNFSGGAQGITWSTSGSGSFSNNTDPNATYTLSNADIAAGAVQLTITTITNGTCTASSDAVTLNVRALPNITAGSDIIACTAAPVQLAANPANAPGGTWTTSGTGTFFDANALATLYFPSAADSTIGTVTLTVTTTGTLPCSAVSDALIITFGGGLAAQAGQDVIDLQHGPEHRAERSGGGHYHGSVEHHGHRFLQPLGHCPQRHLHRGRSGLRDRQHLLGAEHHQQRGLPCRQGYLGGELPCASNGECRCGPAALRWPVADPIERHSPE